jgi:hypothetical protein
VIFDPEADAKGLLFIWRIGTDHSVYDLDDLFKEFRSDD